MHMPKEPLRPGVFAEADDPLAPKKEVYWVDKGNDAERIVVSSREHVDDQEIAWAQARLTEFVRVQRTLMQRTLKTVIPDTMNHPSGHEMKNTSKTRQGYVMTAAPTADLMTEVGKRIKLDTANLIQISDKKVYVENSVPVKIHNIETAKILETLGNPELPVAQVEAVYRKVLETLPTIVTKHSDRMSAADQTAMFDLSNFRRDHVRWASLTEKGGMIAQEPGVMGGAWIFVVPPGNFMIQQQKATHSMNLDNAGINAYLSILPYAVSEKWAALGLVHELSHLRDYVLGIEPAKGRTRDQYLDGEHRAYSAERALAFAYSNGQLQSTLQSIVEKAMSQPDSVQALNALVNQELSSITQSLDQTVEPNPPKSLSEMGIRQGLYMMLLGFEMARQMAKGNDEAQKYFEKKFIEMIYEPLGVLPKN